MTAKTELSAPKRRTRAEVQQLVAEFVSSGMRRSEFCQSRGLSFSTLDRHLKKRRWKRMHRPTSPAGRLVPVELAAKLDERLLFFGRFNEQRGKATVVDATGVLAVLVPGDNLGDDHPSFFGNHSHFVLAARLQFIGDAAQLLDLAQCTVQRFDGLPAA